MKRVLVTGAEGFMEMQAKVGGTNIHGRRFREREGFRYVRRGAFGMFDIAESREEFESLIYERLYNTKLDSNVIEKRKAYFEKHVSSLKCDSIKKHVDLIRHIVIEEPYGSVTR
jgi:hypothetical protein